MRYCDSDRCVRAILLKSLKENGVQKCRLCSKWVQNSKRLHQEVVIEINVKTYNYKFECSTIYPSESSYDKYFKIISK